MKVEKEINSQKTSSFGIVNKEREKNGHNNRILFSPAHTLRFVRIEPKIHIHA
jgi:hypothetical protein